MKTIRLMLVDDHPLVRDGLRAALTIREELPGIEAEIAAGQFGGLFAWLRERVHAMGASLGLPQLVEHATGRPLSATPFLRYLERKYVPEI